MIAVLLCAATKSQSFAASGPSVTVSPGEFAGFTLVYDLAIPNAMATGATGSPPYTTNNSGSITPGSFDRIAYYLELNNGSGLKFIWISMTPFTTDPTKTGVPTRASGAVFQTTVGSMNVESNVPGIVTGTSIATGNIEFWPFNYVTAAFLPGIGGNAGNYDFNDQHVGSADYGSMQIHNYGAGQTLLSYNDWGNPGSSSEDLGIGNSPVGHPDWTFQHNAATYTTKVLQVYVHPANQPPVGNAGPDQTLEATGATTAVTLDGSASSDPDHEALTYAWTGPFGAATGVSPTVNLGLGTQTISLTVTDGHDASSTADQMVVEVHDTTAPVVTAPANVTTEATGAQTTVDIGTASAIDLVDGTVTVTDNAPSTFPVGTTTVTYTATDASNNSASATQLVSVVDTTPPAIVLNGDSPVTVESPTAYTDAGASATDLVDPTPALVTTGSVDVNAGGTYTLTYTTTDASGNSASTTRTIYVVDTVPPVVTLNGDASVQIECHLGTYTELGATATDASGGDLSFTLVISGSVDINTVGTYTLTYTATDASGNSGFATRTVNVVDTTAPTLTLNGANPLLLELGTAYPEPGATASDLVEGNLTAAIHISGAVNADAEGSYTLTYTVSDAAHNTASATRTVQVVVTANSYGLIATHSMHLRQNAQIHSGFLGVVNRGQAPFLAGKVELVVGTRVQTAEGVRLSAPRMRVRQNASIDGQLIYTELVAVGKHATIAQQTQVPQSYFPLFQGMGLPVFRTSTPGTQDIEVKQKASATLAAGAYDEVRVKQKGTLTFSGGTYHLGDLDVGPNADIRFLAPTILLIRGQLALDQNSTFGPASGSNIDASDILVYVEGRNGRLGNGHDDDEGDDEDDDDEGRLLRKSPRAAKIGVRVSFQGNLYAPNSTIHLRQNSACVGSFIARDLIVGVRVQVAAQSGWNTPGVVFVPVPPAPLAKLAGAAGEAGALPEGTGLLANYPNPFNPSTTVPYVLAEAGLVKLSVYNVLGQQIRVLVDQLQVPGTYTVSWDGMDTAGLQAAGGVYFYRLEAGNHIQVMKMLFAK